MDRAAELSASVSSRDARALRRAEGTEDPHDQSDGPEDMDTEQGDRVETVPAPQQLETGKTFPGPSADIKTEKPTTASKAENSHGEDQPGRPTIPSKLPPREDDTHVVSGRPQTSGDASNQVTKSAVMLGN